MTNRIFQITKELLQQEYVNKGKTYKEIAQQLGCGETIIYARMKEYGIPSRPRKIHLKGRPFSVTHRINLAKSKMGKKKGSANPNWRGGISIDHTAIRKQTEHSTWRKFVLRLHGNICGQCSKNLLEECPCCGHKPDRHVHHVKDFANHPHLRFSLDNAIVLCETCHRKSHKK